MPAYVFAAVYGHIYLDHNYQEILLYDYNLIPVMNKKILIAINIVVAAIVISFGIYTITPLFTSNTVNEPLPTTAAGVKKTLHSRTITNLFR